MSVPVADESSAPRGVNALRDRLREAIVSGEIPGGTVYAQTQLAESFGVSRTPMREALRMLEREDLVVREDNGRFRIAAIQLDTLDQLTAMRIALEATAIRLTVPTLTAVDHAELEGLLAQATRLAELNEWEEFERPHLAFHLKLTSGVGPAYTEQIRRLWGHATRYRRAHWDIVMDQDGPQTGRREHRAMLDAVEAHDGDAAARMLAIQYARSALTIAASVDPEDPMHRVRTALQRESGSRDLPAD